MDASQLEEMQRQITTGLGGVESSLSDILGSESEALYASAFDNDPEVISFTSEVYCLVQEIITDCEIDIDTGLSNKQRIDFLHEISGRLGRRLDRFNGEFVRESMQ